MDEDAEVTLAMVLARLDMAMEELTALRRRVAELTSERDVWRARSGL